MAHGMGVSCGGVLKWGLLYRMSYGGATWGVRLDCVERSGGVALGTWACVVSAGGGRAVAECPIRPHRWVAKGGAHLLHFRLPARRGEWLKAAASAVLRATVTRFNPSPPP